MKIFSKFPTVNILNLNFCFVICIAKNFIKTALRQFSQYLDFFAPSDSRFSNSCISDKYCPIIGGGGSIAYKNVVLGFVVCLLYTLLLGIVLFLLQVRNDDNNNNNNGYFDRTLK